jgi:hypothetical protein
MEVSMLKVMRIKEVVSMSFNCDFSEVSSQISALQSFNTILMNTFGWDSSTTYAHEGISRMNGRKDSAEYFSQLDFQTTLTFAGNNHLAIIILPILIGFKFFVTLPIRKESDHRSQSHNVFSPNVVL